MGFGLGSKMHRYSVKPASLPRGKTKEHVRYLTTEDIPALNDCYNRFYENRNGMIKHNEGRWQNRFEFAEKLRFVGCEINGRLEGYLIYSFKPPERPTSFMDNDLVVSEFFYHTPDALSELLTFLHTQLDQADRVVLQTPEEEFYFLMSDPTVSSGSMEPSARSTCVYRTARHSTSAWKESCSIQSKRADSLPRSSINRPEIRLGSGVRTCSYVWRYSYTAAQQISLNSWGDGIPPAGST